MAHKTITISEEAYDALAGMKKENESFTDVLLRLTSRKGSPQVLLDFIKRLPPSEDLAHNIEISMMRTRKARLRKIKLN